MHWREAGDRLKDVAAFQDRVMNYTAARFPEQLRSGQVSTDFFRLFGVKTSSTDVQSSEDRPQGDRSRSSASRPGLAASTAIRNIVGKTIS